MAVFSQGKLVVQKCHLSMSFMALTDNADRHHYETFAEDGDNGRLLHLDNGKGWVAVTKG